MVHAVSHHSLMYYSLELLQIITLITQLAILEAITAIPTIFAQPRVLIKWHQTTFTHSLLLEKRHKLMHERFTHF